MSIPDLIHENQLGCKNLFLRLSEYEDPSFIPAEAEGLWVDFFRGKLPKDIKLLEMMILQLDLKKMHLILLQT